MKERPSKGTVLLVSRSPSLTKTVREGLSPTGTHLVTVGSLGEANDWLFHATASLLLIDPPTSSAQVFPFLTSIQAQGTPPAVVVFVRSPELKALHPLIRDGRFCHFVGLTEDDSPDTKELEATVLKLATRDLFGLKQYLGNTPMSHSVSVSSTADRSSLVDRVLRFAQDMGCHPRIADSFAMATDELLTNALFNAPVDGLGRARHAHVDRRTPVQLNEGERVLLEYAFDGSRMAVSVSDPFGSLDCNLVLRYLDKCLRHDELQVDSKRGGAGLGLYFVMQFVQKFVLNVQPGQRTEAIGIIEPSASFRKFSTRAKSLHLFTT